MRKPELAPTTSPERTTGPQASAGAIRPVTDLHASVSELSPTLLAAAYDVVPVPVVVAWRDGGLTLNAAARLLMGEGEAHTVDTHYERLRARCADGRALASDDFPLGRALRGERVTGVKLIVDPAGISNRAPIEASAAGEHSESDRLWSAEASPIVQDGTIVGAVCTYRDLTDRSLDEDMADDLLATAAHDLRTPLTALKASAQLVSRGLERLEPAARERTLGLLLSQVDKLATRIDDVVDAARIRRGRVDVEPVVVDVSHELTEIVAAVAALPGAPRCETKIAPGLRAFADPARLRQIFRKLILDAGERGGSASPVVVQAGARVGGDIEIVIDVQRGAGSTRSRTARRLASMVVAKLGGVTVDEASSDRRSIRMTLPPAPPESDR